MQSQVGGNCILRLTLSLLSTKNVESLNGLMASRPSGKFFWDCTNLWVSHQTTKRLRYSAKKRPNLRLSCHFLQRRFLGISHLSSTNGSFSNFLNHQLGLPPVSVIHALVLSCQWSALFSDWETGMERIYYSK